MSTLGFNFDASQHNPSFSGGGTLPVGLHPVVIVGSETKPTKNNDGGYLQFNVQVIDGPQKGASGPWRLNLYNGNAQAVEIAKRQLSALCHVVGVQYLSDSDEPLWNKPFCIEVGPQADPKYTEVKGVKTIDGRDPQHCGFAAAPAPAAPAAAPAPAAGGWTAPGAAAAPAAAAPAPAAGGWAPPGAAAAPAAQAPAPAAGGWTPPGGAAAGGGNPPWGAR